jgi:hypothetical protein
MMSQCGPAALRRIEGFFAASLTIARSCPVPGSLQNGDKLTGHDPVRRRILSFFRRGSVLTAAWLYLPAI